MNNMKRSMKLQDCGCGGTPQVKYVINDIIEYVVICTACRSQTPVCESVKEAVALWNQTYCCAPTPYEMVSA